MSGQVSGTIVGHPGIYGHAVLTSASTTFPFLLTILAVDVRRSLFCSLLLTNRRRGQRFNFISEPVTVHRTSPPRANL